MPKLTDAERAKVIDQIGQLTAEVTPALPKIKLLNALEKQAQAWAIEDEKDAKLACRYKGTTGELLLGPRGIKREVRIVGTFKYLGQKAFLAACNFQLGVFEKLVPASKHDALIKSEQIGNRPVTFIPGER